MNLLERVRGLYETANMILAEARASGDARVALLSLDRLAKLMQVEGASLQLLEARGEGEKHVIIKWVGEPCPRCGYNPLDPAPLVLPPAPCAETGDGHSPDTPEKT